MLFKIFILLTFQFNYAFMYVHQKPVAEKVWEQRCTANSYVLNDCNWCKCNAHSKYTCTARACREIDMFGHFNDAIRDINVGMEGHGAWRSGKTPCEAGVHYQREDLICVCDDTGNWPNPVCRDSFRVLHQVQLVNTTKITSKQRCTPTHYHLIGCNVCYCPATGWIDSDLCTQDGCTDDDPVLYKDREVNEISEEPVIQEVYSDCVVGKEYKLGCRSCVCLKNNRLLCGNCSAEPKPVTKAGSYCDSKKPGEIFSVDCNLCYCDKNLIYCTAKKCIKPPLEAQIKKQLNFIDNNLKQAEGPIEDENCIPGTTYTKDCNTCYCVEKNGVKIYGCTMNNCLEKEDIYTSCVVGTAYELDCQICYCSVVNGYKRQMCKVDNKCSNIDATKVPRSNKLSSLHGYCEPLHLYQKDCNQCRCLADGKTTLCTSGICDKSNPVSVEIIPVLQEYVDCPKGHSYKVDCNVCFCLPNGNAICTLKNC